MSPDFILNVNEADFEYEVISYSNNTPVVVDFWAPWCQPCRTLSPMLERLTREANGSFRLAKVDVEANPNLAMKYSVRSIPTVKAFIQGQVVAEFSGLVPENRLRDFLARLAPPSENALAIEKALSILADHRWKEAETLLRELDQTPAILLGLGKALLGQGRAREAQFLLRNFPASREYIASETLRPLADALVELETNRLPEQSDLDFAFRNAVRLAGRGNLPAALDGLLDILRQDKRYQSGRARLVVLAILDLLGNDDPLTGEYRAELSAILF